jgi:peptidyl-prolyl cis-trans isomerase B (cyclophilin B)
MLTEPHGKPEMAAHLMKNLFILALYIGTWTFSPPCFAKEPPFNMPAKPEVLKIRSAIVETSKGKLFLELFPEEAPWHVTNFKYLADKGFYKTLTFHFAQRDYLIQGGDPLKNGRGGPGYDLPAEFSSRNHTLATVGMARKPDVDEKTGKRANPERRSNGSQFHILLADAPHMDGHYTIFGKVVGGFDTLKDLRAGDRIIRVTVFIREGGR